MLPTHSPATDFSPYVPMSVAMLTRVWRHSSQKGGALLVLLAIADYADDRGVAYPSIGSLKAKSRLSERSVQASLQQLTEAHELAIEHQAGPHRCNLYRIVLDPDPADFAPRKYSTPQKRVAVAEGADHAAKGAENNAQRVQFAHERVQPAAPKPSLRTVNKNRHRTVTGSRARAREEIQMTNDQTNQYPDVVTCLGCDVVIDTENFKTAHPDTCEFFRNTPAQLTVRHAAGPLEHPVQEAV